MTSIHSHKYAVFLVAWAIVSTATARSWWSLEIPALDSVRNDDPVFSSSSQLTLEDLSFLFGSLDLVETVKSSPNAKPHTPVTPMATYPTPSPTVSSHSPTLRPIASSYENIIPTLLPSDVQMVSSKLPVPTVSPAPTLLSDHHDSGLPTWSPSSLYQSANGNCPSDETLYRLSLYDSFGDGWGFTKLYIKDRSDGTGSIFHGGLIDGYEEDFYLCLKPESCYSAKIHGEGYLDEISWVLKRVDFLTGDSTYTMAVGVGEGGKCDFGLGCKTTCLGSVQEERVQDGAFVIAVNQNETAKNSTVNMTTVGETEDNMAKRDNDHKKSNDIKPTYASPELPTNQPTKFRTKRPTTGSPTEYLPQDKSLKLGGEEFKRLQNIIRIASPKSSGSLIDKESAQFLAFHWMYKNGPIASVADRRLVQRWILASFYFGLGGDNWVINDGWLTENDECQWYGVTCIDGVVSELELEQNRLVGEVIPEISLLGGGLYILSLGNDFDTPDNKRNEIVMPLTSFFGDLEYLTFLNLEGIGLFGTIPDNLFDSWAHLEFLYLNDNDLVGELPRSIANAKSLEVLWLGGNNLGGPIISEIGAMTSLIDLSLESNFREDKGGKRGFIMTLPPEVGSLTSLEILVLADNALSGSLPMQLGDLISLRHLHLNSNFFESQLPTALGNLQMLEEMDLSFNWLSSTIPPEIGNMISLQVSLSHAQFFVIFLVSIIIERINKRIYCIFKCRA